MNIIEQLEALIKTGGVAGIYRESSHVVLISDLRAIIKQAKREAVEPVAVPAGYKLVPIKPTQEMQNAAIDNYMECHECISWTGIYEAMLSAAPEAQQTAGGD